MSTQTTERWNHVSGYCFFVRNTKGREFPMVQTFGLSVKDAKARAEEMLQTRREKGRSRVEIVALAAVTLHTDQRLVEFDHKRLWHSVSDEAFPPAPRSEVYSPRQSAYDSPVGGQGTSSEAVGRLMR